MSLSTLLNYLWRLIEYKLSKGRATFCIQKFTLEPKASATPRGGMRHNRRWFRIIVAYFERPTCVNGSRKVRKKQPKGGILGKIASAEISRISIFLCEIWMNYATRFRWKCLSFRPCPVLSHCWGLRGGVVFIVFHLARAETFPVFMPNVQLYPLI